MGTDGDPRPAGQFLIGDNAFGGVQSFCEGPDGTIYGGTLGYQGNGWAWLGKVSGMMKWKPNGSAFASIASVSSQKEGFDLHFTDALAANAANPDWFWGSSYLYEPTSAYGGPILDLQKMNITAISTSADRKTLALSVAGLAAGRIYRIMLAPDVKTQAGASLWTRNAWYTLNNISDALPLATAVAVRPVARSGPAAGAEVTEIQGSIHVNITGAGPYSIRLVDLKGAELGSLAGQGPAERDMARGAGLRLLQVTTGAGSFSRLLGHAGP